jgi:hypothetical protein
VTGGFNLQSAWTTGWLAGKAIGNKWWSKQKSMIDYFKRIGENTKVFKCDFLCQT